MPYLNLDDEFTEHPKVDALSDGAFRLHVSGLRYCAKNTSDGVIPEARVERLKPRFRPSQLQELLKGGLWHHGGQGCATEFCPLGVPATYVVHDYLQWNKSAEWWNERRTAEAERKADYRRKQAAKPKGLRSA